MKASEVRALKDAELDVLAKQFKSQLFTMRNKSVGEPVEDNSQFKKVRRDVARLMTERTARAKAR
jgi:large subunit ribosomal protein L29